MISNNKNKNSKELTLEEIIQKSAFRKNIDSLCVIQTKLNKDQSNPVSSTHTPTYLNKRFQQLFDLQTYASKNPFQPIEKVKRKAQHISTARTAKSLKYIASDPISSKQSSTKNIIPKIEDQPQLYKEFKNSHQIQNFQQNLTLERKSSSKNKTKTKSHSDYLCVKGASGTIITKPLIADGNPLNIPQYEMKKYQTLVSLGTQFHKKQQSLQFPTTNHQDPSSQTSAINYNSFMLTKYTTSNNFRKKSIKSVQTKNNSTNKLRTNIVFPEELLNKKILYRGIKTEEKMRVKIDNIEEDCGGDKKKKMKKFQLILGIDRAEQIIKEKRGDDETFNLKTESNDAEMEKAQKNISLSKHQLTDNMNQSKTKGFKGTKRKSAIIGEKIKSRYFIPDFIKPSLDLIMFEKKLVQVIKDNQNKIVESQHKDIQNVNVDKALENEAQCIRGKIIILNTKSEHHLAKESVEQMIKQQQNETDQNMNNVDDDKRNNLTSVNRITKSKSKTDKNKGSLRGMKNQFQQLEICGWEDSEKVNKKTKNKMFMNTATEMFEL